MLHLCLQASTQLQCLLCIHLWSSGQIIHNERMKRAMGMQASMSSAYLLRLDGRFRHAPFALVHVHTGHLGGFTSSPWWHRHATPGAKYAEVLG